MSQKLSFVATYFEIVYMSFIVHLLNLFVLFLLFPASLSFLSLFFACFLESIFLLFSSVSAHVRLWPSTRCNQAPVVWSGSRSTSMCWPALRRPASHQQERWSERRVKRMRHYLATRSISAAVISLVRLSKDQRESSFIRTPETLGCKTFPQIFFSNNSLRQRFRLRLKTSLTSWWWAPTVSQDFWGQWFVIRQCNRSTQLTPNT